MSSLKELSTLRAIVKNKDILLFLLLADSRIKINLRRIHSTLKYNRKEVYPNNLTNISTKVSYWKKMKIWKIYPYVLNNISKKFPNMPPIKWAYVKHSKRECQRVTVTKRRSFLWLNYSKILIWATKVKMVYLLTI